MNFCYVLIFRQKKFMKEQEMKAKTKENILFLTKKRTRKNDLKREKSTVVVTYSITGNKISEFVQSADTILVRTIAWIQSSNQCLDFLRGAVGGVVFHDFIFNFDLFFGGFFLDRFLLLLSSFLTNSFCFFSPLLLSTLVTLVVVVSFGDLVPKEGEAERESLQCV